MKTALIVTSKGMPERHKQKDAAREWGAEQLWIDNIESRRALMLTKPQTPPRRGDKLAKTLKFR